MAKPPYRTLENVGVCDVAADGVRPQDGGEDGRMVAVWELLRAVCGP